MIESSLLSYLGPLEDATSELRNTWHPEDPAYRADVYRQVMGSLSYSYFAYFHATPEHPDWSPLWNPVYNFQSNPDDTFLYSPVRGDLTYRVSGNRGTIKVLSFTTQHLMTGMADEPSDLSAHNDIDDEDLLFDDNGDFELIFSNRRPDGFSGNWAPMHPKATAMMVRMRSYDWENEIDPRLSIECLETMPPKPRLTPEQITERIEEMAKLPARKSRSFYRLQNAVKDSVGFNVFHPMRMTGALTKQVYLPACFQLNDDEALIMETELPQHRPYWNFQLNDPYFNALEYVYRFSSLNGHTAKISSDGKFRAVIAMHDPGVPNWLDPAGFNEGGIYGRWYNCDSAPTPTLTRVPLAELRQHLPSDTPVVTAQERAEQLRKRVRASQRRRRW